MRRARPPAATACSALIRMLRNACCRCAGSHSTGGSFSPCLRTILMSALREVRLAAGDARASGSRSTCVFWRAMRCEPVNTSRLRTIFAARSASWKICFSSRFTGRAAGVHVIAVRDAHHPLQRVVHLVGDPGDELPERGELLRLREPFAQRRALRLEPRLPRDVARDEHAPERVPSWLVSGVAVSRNVPSSSGVVDAPLHGGTVPCPVSAASHVGERLGADQPAERPRMRSARFTPTRAANASFVCTMRSSLSMTATRSTSELNVSSSRRRWRRMSSSSWTFSIADRQLARQLARELEELVVVETVAAVRRCVPSRSMTSVPSARRQPRSGATSVSRRRCGRSRRSPPAAQWRGVVD